MTVAITKVAYVAAGGGYYDGGYYGGADYGPTVVVSSRDREHYQGYGYSSGYYDRENDHVNRNVNVNRNVSVNRNSHVDRNVDVRHSKLAY